MPPGYRHSGQLIHFNSDCHPVMRNDAEEGLETEDSRIEISQDEFEEIKSTIQSLKVSLETIEAENKQEMLDASVEGLFPSFSDHSMDKYLRLIRKQANVGNLALATEFQQTHIQSKIESFEIRREAEATGLSEELVSAQRAETNKPIVIPALLQTKSGDWTAPEGIRINSQFGSIVSVQSETFDALRKLENDPDVLSIAVSRDAGMEELENSIPFVGADNIHRPNIQEKGSSAIVGIIDTGIDILHDCFTDLTGQTRILAIWDQRSNDSGSSPFDKDPNNFSQSYGRLYLQSEINQFRTNPSNTPTVLRDFGKHGTHVASIAAGRSVGNDLKDGMAPESGIIVVIPNMKTSRNDPPSLGYSSSHVDALHFLKIAAAGNNTVSSTEMPIAVNVSLGMNAGAHDGSSLLEIAFDAVSNNGRDPGFVVVKSAGNERGHGGHARIRALGQKEIEWDANDNSRFQDYFEAWYSYLDDLQFQLVDPDGNQSSVIDSNNLSTDEMIGGNQLSMKLQLFHPDNGDNRLIITVEENHKRIREGKWKLIVTPIKVRSQNAFLDMWVERDRSRAVTFRDQNNELTLSIPGTAQHVITVGACGSSLPIKLTPSSSYGRTRDDRPKPDICAPGTDIVAAAGASSSGLDVATSTGTSMAAPHVAGAIALLFSHRHKKPGGQSQLNARQILAGLINTAKTTAGSMLHDEGVGFGAMDAEEFFKSMS